ncbi:MAG: antitoxin Xre/MbcA/ParS toxin-binding domain-containing protein [Dongiaceae bacterium]
MELSESEARPGEAAEVRRVAELLGGPRVLRHRLRNALDVHEALAAGLPGAALTHLLDSLVSLRDPASIERAVGISRRTFQRRKAAPKKPLSPEQSGRTWTFAAVLAKATAAFGSQAAAEQWLERPAIGLDQRRPIDLLATPTGVRLIEEHLGRIEYGVYA